MGAAMGDQPTGPDAQECAICYGKLWSLRDNIPKRYSNPKRVVEMAIATTGCCKASFHMSCYRKHKASKLIVWNQNFNLHNAYLDWANWDPCGVCNKAALPRLNPVHEREAPYRLLPPVWDTPRAPDQCILRAVRARFDVNAKPAVETAVDFIDLTGDRIVSIKRKDVLAKRVYPKDVVDLCTDFKSFQRWELLQNTLNDYGMAIQDLGQDCLEHSERRRVSLRDPDPIRDWCKVWLEELVVFYRIEFGETITSNRPLAQCGHFNQRPLACYEKFLDEFTNKIDFLDLEDSYLKRLFLEGIPTASASFREFLLPLVANGEITLSEMIALGSDELQRNADAHVSIRQTRRRVH
jgi:hypothetical protein